MPSELARGLHFGFHLALAIRHAAFVFLAARGAAVGSTVVRCAGSEYLAGRYCTLGVAGHGGSATRHGARAGSARARSRLGRSSLSRGGGKAAQAGG
jgi:hypothetical protein